MPISQNGQTLKQFVGKFETNYLRVFDHFAGLALKGISVFVLFWKAKLIFKVSPELET